MIKEIEKRLTIVRKELAQEQQNFQRIQGILKQTEFNILKKQGAIEELEKIKGAYLEHEKDRNGSKPDENSKPSEDV